VKPPARVTDGAASGLGARLVRAARADVPPGASRERAVATAALAAATVSVGVAAGGTLTGGTLAKWLAWGGGGLVLAVGAVVMAGTGPRTEAAPPATATATATATVTALAAASSVSPPPVLLPSTVAVPVEALPSAPMAPAMTASASRAVALAAPVSANTTTATERPLAQAAQPSTARSSLTQEIALLDEAKVALGASRHDAALALLDRHARAFPHGALFPEATALRIEALYRQGDRAAASTLFRRFEEKNPNSPLLDHLRLFASSSPTAD